MKHITLNLLTQTNELLRLIEQTGEEYEWFDSLSTKQTVMFKLFKYGMALHLEQNRLIMLDDNSIYKFLLKSLKAVVEQINKSEEWDYKFTLNYCRHQHQFTPINTYVGVQVEGFDKNVISKEPEFSFMISPYIGEFGEPEVGLSVKSASPQGVWLIKNYHLVQEQINERIKITNLSPGNLYMYVLLYTLLKRSNPLSTNSSWYENDVQALKIYTNELNNVVPNLNLKLTENNTFEWNKDIKIKQVTEETLTKVVFPGIVSFLYE